MCPGQGPTAELAVPHEAALAQALDTHGYLHIPQLANIEVDGSEPRPPEKDIAGRLHEILSADYSLGVVEIGTRPEVGLENRCLSLLDLQEERVTILTPHEQGDVTTRTHAPHTDDFIGNVNEVVFPEQHVPVFLQRCAVTLHKHAKLLGKLLVIEVRDRRWVILDAVPPIHFLDEPGECHQDRAPASLLQLFLDIGAVAAANEPAYTFGIDAVIPYIDMAHLPVLQQAFTIGSYAPHYRLPVHFAGEAQRTSRDDDACGKPLDIPLPWTWERLIKVVHIEDLVPLRRCVDAEVAEVGIATHLHLQACHGSCSKIACHNNCRAAQKGKR